MEPLEPALARSRLSCPGIDAPTGTADAVYTKDDPDVIAPQGVYAKLPSNPSGSFAPKRAVLELLISADSLVERVRLRTPPRNVHEFRLVSAARAWRLDPATANGRLVRFLHTIAAQPARETKRTYRKKVFDYFSGAE
jgi:hypothetical protein